MAACMILLISPGLLVLWTTDTLMLELDLTCSTPLFRRDRPSFVSKSATTHPERTFSLGSSFKVRYFKLWASDAALEAEDRTAYSSNLGRGNTASPKKSTYFALSGEIGRMRSTTHYLHHFFLNINSLSEKLSPSSHEKNGNELLASPDERTLSLSLGIIWSLSIR